MRTRTSVVLRMVRLIAGLYLFALGTVMAIRAELGISPWDVLADGISNQTPLTFGRAAIVIGAVLVLGALAFGVKPGFGTIANMLLIGPFVDLMLDSGAGDSLGDEHVALRALVLLGGVLMVGLGSALYIGAAMGAGPRDSLMVTVATRTPLSVRASRTSIEGSVLVAGALLGGSFGVGTALFALTIGPSVHLFFDLFGMDAAGRRVIEGG